MTTIKLLLATLLTGTILGVFSLFIFFQNNRWPLIPTENLVASTSNTYLGPQKPVVGDPQLVRVQVLIHDAPESSGMQIISVTFDGQTIPLQPRDIYGNRGAGSFQMSPGTYLLRWRVNRDRKVWPRTLTREEEVTISPRDLWLQITIDGENVSIR